MKNFNKIVALSAAAAGLVACGGGDTDDRLDTANPSLRFVHASPLAPNVSLFRGAIPQNNVVNVQYKFASDYFDIETGTSEFSVKTAIGNVNIGTEVIDAKRGNKYTIVAVPSSNTDNSLYMIRDPYNKSLTSDKAKLRVMHAAFNAGNIDVYMTGNGVNIDAVGVNPIIASTAYKTSGPATGSDSFDISEGNYQLIITAAASKVILFKGPLNVGKNNDILLVAVPSSLVPGAIKVLVKTQGTPGTSEVPAG